MPKITRTVSRHAPPIDWLWAAILERKMVNGYDLKAMSKIAGVSYEYMRRIINRPPGEWPYEVLENVCSEFGIKLVPSVDGSSPPKGMQ